MIKFQTMHLCDKIPNNATVCLIAFASKSLSSTEWQYSNIEQEALGILHWPNKIHHYCFAKELCVITDHKPLVAMANKDVVTLSLHLQHIILHIH